MENRGVHLSGLSDEIREPIITCGHCVKFFGYYIKNQFLGNVMQVCKCWNPSNLDGHSPVQTELLWCRREEAAQPTEEPGLKEWIGTQPPREFRKRPTPAKVALPPAGPRGLFPP